MGSKQAWIGSAQRDEDFCFDQPVPAGLPPFGGVEARCGGRAGCVVAALPFALFQRDRLDRRDGDCARRADIDEAAGCGEFAGPDLHLRHAPGDDGAVRARDHDAIAREDRSDGGGVTVGNGAVEGGAAGADGVFWGHGDGFIDDGWSRTVRSREGCYPFKASVCRGGSP